MNNERRKAIAAIQDRIAELAQRAESIREEIEAVRDEEQDYFDNMPESFQQGERGQRAEEVIGYLDDAMSELESIDADAITGPLEEAAS